MSGPYDVFLSHSTEDKAAVEHLALRLREAGLQPFLDKWHLLPGQPWISELEVALAGSRTVAVFFGASSDGPWRAEELQLALHKAVASRESFRVFSVLLPGSREQQMPDFLRLRTWVDFRAGLEDRSAFAQLVAGIKGQATEPGASALPDAPAPYRGLLRFEERDADLFFGRAMRTFGACWTSCSNGAWWQSSAHPERGSPHWSGPASCPG